MSAGGAAAPGPADEVEVAAFYRDAEANGYGWGSQFRGLTSITVCDGAAVGKIVLSNPALVRSSPFVLDPRAVDSALQLMLACDAHGGATGLVPFEIARVIVASSIGREASARIATRLERDEIVATVTIAGADGMPSVRVAGLRARRRRRTSRMRAGSAASPSFYREIFEPVEASPVAQIPGGTWLLLAGANCPTTRTLAAAMKRRGLPAELLEMAVARSIDPSTYVNAIRRTMAAAPLAGIVYSVPLSLPVKCKRDIANAAMTQVMRATAFAKAISQIADDAPLPSICVLTHQARAHDEADVISNSGLAQSPLLGLVRTIGMEVPSVDFRLIDLDEHALRDHDGLLDLLTGGTRESEIHLRAGRITAARLTEIAAGDLAPSQIPHSKLRSRNFALRHRGPPGAEGLVWQEATLPPLRPDDIAVEVRAVGLNFRDAMAVSGLLPERAEPTPAVEALGLELSGVVVGRGADVRDLDIGDHVIGMGRGALQRRVIWPRVALQRAPPGLSHIDAATLPSAYLTAHHALNKIARLQREDSVLIHSATGGVGLAAIAMARHTGARIIATAGSPEKRAHLARLGIEHVFDSRSLGFADDVMRATGGRGVDVVLNSLGGHFIEQGLACLAPYGRFLELGKRDVYDDNALGLRRMRSNVSFHVIDLAALIAERPLQAAGLLAEVVSMLAAHQIEPLPATVFSTSRVRDAFGLFAGARHIGKFVVEFEEGSLLVERAQASGAPLDPNGTYLVTGGARGFGRVVGEWLAARGAGRVILTSRTADARSDPPGPANIEQMRLDVTDAARVDETIAKLARADKPLRGVIHAAVVYDDALLPDMTEDQIRRVLAPKIDGALNLTRAVERTKTKLDFFVSFSSLAQVVGWPAQSNYAAANAFLEGLAHWQRSRGIPGQCINWGALVESGHVARSTQMQTYLASAGWIGIDNAAALAGLAKVLDCDIATPTLAAADWGRLAATHPTLGRSPRTASLASRAADAVGSRSNGLAGLDGEALQAAALLRVREEAAKVLRAGVDDIAGDVSLADAGIDSLSSFELRLRIEQTLRLELPMARYVRATRLVDLAALVCALIEEAQARAD